MCSLNASRVKRSTSCPRCQDQLWALTSLSYSTGTEVKQRGHEGDNSPPFSAEVKNEWSYTSILAISLQVVDRDNFTFYLYLFYSLQCHSQFSDSFSVPLGNTLH